MGPRVLVLVPTRELALQVADHAERLGAHTKLRSAAIFGGVSLVNQEKVVAAAASISSSPPPAACWTTFSGKQHRLRQHRGVRPG
ncbi:MAG: DEAD/DEAH box helicase [Anaerolineae bacterium]